jgi:uncharacterized spore protein YtfJ
MSKEMEFGPMDSGGDVGSSIASAIRGITEHATVDRVYGEPITADGRVVVPVARVRYGFGLGAGTGGQPTTEGSIAGTSEGDGEETGTGAGGGGGMTASPVGVIEITGDETRFIRFTNWPSFVLAAGLGVAIGVLLGRRRR